jgi:hypothetical protein
MKKARKLTRNKWNNIERIWADKGIVKVMTKKGELFTLTPKEAANRARILNSGLPEEPSAKEHVLKLIDEIISVCREALHQIEDPANTTVSAMSKAIAMFERVIPETPKLFIDIQKALLEFPGLARDEIKTVLTTEDWSDSFKRAVMQEVNKERVSVWLKDSVLTKPI